MTYSPEVYAPMPSVFLSSISPESLGSQQRTINPASAAWSTTNRIIYAPFILNRPMTVFRLWWLNGSTVGTNNFQAGVYDANFNRLIAGSSTLSAGANVCQFDNITDTGLDKGRYWMALWGNGTTATIFRVATAGQSVGVFYETAAGGLPDPGTPTSPAASAPAIPVFGLAFRASP